MEEKEKELEEETVFPFLKERAYAIITKLIPGLAKPQICRIDHLINAQTALVKLMRKIQIFQYKMDKGHK